jgi:tRNA threonylcarbamoyl adenosine modification protein YeaZ
MSIQLPRRLSNLNHTDSTLHALATQSGEKSVLTLALENSSRRASVALFDGEELIASDARLPGPRAQEQIFELMCGCLERAQVECAEIGRFIVGRGPGNYTGLRITFAMAQALALPGSAQVHAVSSGYALALERLNVQGDERVLVAGDARRGMYWAGLFRCAGSKLQIERDWCLLTSDDLLSLADEAETQLISPELERLLAKLPLGECCGSRLPAESFYPDAAWLARIAFDRIGRGGEGEALEPLYMHPPV